MGAFASGGIIPASGNKKGAELWLTQHLAVQIRWEGRLEEVDGKGRAGFTKGEGNA